MILLLHHSMILEMLSQVHESLQLLYIMSLLVLVLRLGDGFQFTLNLCTLTLNLFASVHDQTKSPCGTPMNPKNEQQTHVMPKRKHQGPMSLWCAGL